MSIYVINVPIFIHPTFMQELYLIGGMMFVTFLIRYLPLAVSGRIQLTPRLIQALQFVPPAILTAIVVPAVLISTDKILISYTNARLIGAIAAIAVGWFTQNLLLTIVVGMLAFFGWQGLLAVFS